jgi:hypothetical protein
MRKSVTTYTAPAALLAAVIFAYPARSATIAINYSFSGTAEVVGATDTTLTLDALANGSITSGNPALNALWNPVAYSDESILDLDTGLLGGGFTITFADGAQLFGNLSEDDTAILQSPSQTGPFTQSLTFTGGTAEFAGATGLASGLGLVGTDDFSVSGSGTLNAPAIPEPASAALLFGGLIMVVAGAKRRSVKRTPGPVRFSAN